MHSHFEFLGDPEVVICSIEALGETLFFIVDEVTFNMTENAFL